jgi:hypothetical protein
MADSFSRFAAQIAALRSGDARGSDTLKLSHLVPLAGEIAEVMVDEVADWRVLFIDRPPVAALSSSSYGVHGSWDFRSMKSAPSSDLGDLKRLRVERSAR